MSHPHDDHDSGIYDLGLAADFNMWNRKPLERRRVLQLGLVAAGALLSGCATSGQGQGAGGTTAGEIPAETAGPFPADGSRGVNVLERSGIVRSDITTSLETGNTAEGVPLTINLHLHEAGDESTPLVGYAVYLWHCDREGNYSMYSNGVTNEDYLRGVQATDSEGKLTFTSVFPACYAGRWPHVHFEVYGSLDTATSAANVLHTSQLAIPEDVCDTVYDTVAGYDQSVRNLSQISLETDNVFSDGVSEQMATVTGSVDGGYTASLTFGVDV